MGWCHEFGITVRDGCDHPMTAAADSCYCEVCGFVCSGNFAGCAAVWQRSGTARLAPPTDIASAPSRPMAPRATLATGRVAVPAEAERGAAAADSIAALEAMVRALHQDVAALTGTLVRHTAQLEMLTQRPDPSAALSKLGDTFSTSTTASLSASAEVVVDELRHLTEAVETAAKSTEARLGHLADQVEVLRERRALFGRSAAPFPWRADPPQR